MKKERYLNWLRDSALYQMNCMILWPKDRRESGILNGVKWLKGAALAGLSLWFAAAGGIPAAAAQIKEVKIRLEAEAFEEDGWPCLEAYCASSRYTVTGIERLGKNTDTAVGPSEGIWGAGPAKSGLSGDGPLGAEPFKAERENSGQEERERENSVQEERECENSVQEERERENNVQEERERENSVQEEWECKNNTQEERRPESGEERAFEIELAAEEEDGFAVMEQKDIRFSGIPAICTKAVRKDSGQTLLLTMVLKEPGELVGEIGHVSLDGASARWEAAPNTSSYLVMLYRNQKRVGYSHRTAGLEYDFSPLIREKGVYFCKVFPLTESGKKGSQAVSAQRQIGEEEIERIRQLWEKSPAGQAGADCQGSDSEGENGGKYGWRLLGNRRIYLERDGCVPQENWLLLDSSWYYFDKEGAVKTDCWQEWKGCWYALDSEGRIKRECASLTE